MITQFVQQYIGFDHITRGEVIRNHTTIIARELLLSGDSNTTILLIDDIYLQRKKYKICFLR